MHSTNNLNCTISIYPNIEIKIYDIITTTSSSTKNGIYINYIWNMPPSDNVQTTYEIIWYHFSRLIVNLSYPVVTISSTTIFYICCKIFGRFVFYFLTYRSPVAIDTVYSKALHNLKLTKSLEIKFKHPDKIH